MKKVILGIIILSNIIWAAGCSSSTIGKEKVSEIYLEEDTAEQLSINLHSDYGYIDISSGAKNWVNGEIKYNSTDLEPKVKYKLTRKKGKVTINQPKKKKINVKNGNLINKWDIKLTNDVPIDLKVSTGASETNMDLQGLQLSKLDVEAGVGSTTVNLGGTWQDSFDVDIQMGVGQTTIILPKEVGVKIKSEKGIGSSNFKGFISEGNGIYVNDAFENANVKIIVKTELGVGEANFELEK